MRSMGRGAGWPWASLPSHVLPRTEARLRKTSTANKVNSRKSECQRVEQADHGDKAGGSESRSDTRAWPMNSASALPGVILAGGRATRMGGGDKGLIELDGVPLLDRVIARLAPQCGPLALNANGNPDRFAKYRLPVLPDSLPDHPGPLAGVLAGLDWAGEQGLGAIVTVAADTPFFPLDLAARLRENAGPEGLCLAASPGPGGKVFRQPAFGLWPVALRDDLRAALMGGLRKVRTWADMHHAGEAIFEPAGVIDPFFNINTPEDLATARQHLAEARSR